MTKNFERLPIGQVVDKHFSGVTYMWLPEPAKDFKNPRMALFDDEERIIGYAHVKYDLESGVLKLGRMELSSPDKSDLQKEITAAAERGLHDMQMLLEKKHREAKEVNERVNALINSRRTINYATTRNSQKKAAAHSPYLRKQLVND